MRKITKDIQITIDGSPKGFRLTKPDAFSGVEILRLLLRLQDQWDGVKRNKSTFLRLHLPLAAACETPRRSTGVRKGHFS